MIHVFNIWLVQIKIYWNTALGNQTQPIWIYFYFHSKWRRWWTNKFTWKRSSFSFNLNINIAITVLSKYNVLEWNPRLEGCTPNLSFFITFLDIRTSSNIESSLLNLDLRSFIPHYLAHESKPYLTFFIG